MTDSERIRQLVLVNLFAVFNQRDAERRLKAIAGNYTDDVIWTDPEGTTHGHEALNDRAQRLLDGLPGFVFTGATDPRQPRSGPSGLQPGSARAAAGGQRPRRRAGQQFQSPDVEPVYVLFEDFTDVKFYRRSFFDVVEDEEGRFEGFSHVDDWVPQRLVTATGPNPLPR